MFLPKYVFFLHYFPFVLFYFLFYIYKYIKTKKVTFTPFTFLGVIWTLTCQVIPRTRSDWLYKNLQWQKDCLWLVGPCFSLTGGFELGSFPAQSQYNYYNLLLFWCKNQMLCLKSLFFVYAFFKKILNLYLNCLYHVSLAILFHIATAELHLQTE